MNSVVPGSQYAYTVEPIHGTAGGSAQSGLVELVALPDGTLLALERSLANAFPPYNSRLFAIDFAAATDVSGPPFDAGLSGTTFNPGRQRAAVVGECGAADSDKTWKASPSGRGSPTAIGYCWGSSMTEIR